jgi:arginine decarboxylase-like protein
MSEEGEVVLDTVISGDTVREVLKYVNFDADNLVRQLRTDVEKAVRQGRFSDEEAGRFMQFYEEGLRDYTYLNVAAGPTISTSSAPSSAVNGQGTREESQPVGAGH